MPSEYLLNESMSVKGQWRKEHLSLLDAQVELQRLGHLPGKQAVRGPGTERRPEWLEHSDHLCHLFCH